MLMRSEHLRSLSGHCHDTPHEQSRKNLISFLHDNDLKVGFARKVSNLFLKRFAFAVQIPKDSVHIPHKHTLLADFMQIICQSCEICIYLLLSKQ